MGTRAKKPLHDFVLVNARRQKLFLWVLLLLVLVVSVCVVWFALYTQELAVENTTAQETAAESTPLAVGPEPFPVSVDPSQELITENPIVETYFSEHISARGGTNGAKTSWVHKVAARLALHGWFQNLASLSSRTLVIQSGERKEEVSENFGKILGWDRTARQEFLALVGSSTPSLTEGMFFPGKYLVTRGATPSQVAPLVTTKFSTEVLSRYSDAVEDLVPLRDTLIIASLLEREAYDFEDMRQISGVIWNRLFIDMNLQLDASLQYAKGTRTDEPWWPKVRPADKYIDSPFNTYQNSGLPPAPIANPSLDAILAALNPKKTDCMYYFHDREGGFHCAPTYEEHVALLKEHYGRGK